MAVSQSLNGVPADPPDAKSCSRAKLLSDSTVSIIESSTGTDGVCNMTDPAGAAAASAAAALAKTTTTTTTTELPDVDDADDALPEPPPPPPATLQVRLNEDPTLGFCVYAVCGFKRGERLFRERTALEATHDLDPRGVRNVYERYCNMSAERKRGLYGSFPVLAWANDVDALEAAEARDLIGSRVISRSTVLDIALTAQDHMIMRPDVPFPEEMVAAAKHVQRKAAAGKKTQTQLQASPPPPLPDSTKSTGTKTRATLADLLWPITHPGEKRRTGAGARRWLHGRDDEGSGYDDDDTKSHKSYKSQRSEKSQQSQRSQLSQQSQHSHHSVASKLSHLSGHSRPAITHHTPEQARRDTLTWFSRYAFRLKPASAFNKPKGHHQAAVYLLTDLINHRCAGFQNCRVAADIGTISVVALRNIAPGEELTIDYGKDKKDFICLGECCRR